MKKSVYSVYDSATSVYGEPRLFMSDDEVKRCAISIFTGDPNPISQHPEDYTLFRVAEFDDQTGAIVPLDAIEPTIRFHELANELRQKSNS